MVQVPQTESPEMMTTPPENPLAYTRVRSHLASNTDSWFSGSDGMSKKRSITGRGPQSTLQTHWQQEVMSAPGVATMCTSCIVKDKVMGFTYMDMVTTSVGRVALSGPNRRPQPMGPKIKDVTDLI